MQVFNDAQEGPACCHGQQQGQERVQRVLPLLLWGIHRRAITPGRERQRQELCEERHRGLQRQTVLVQEVLQSGQPVFRRVVLPPLTEALQEIDHGIPRRPLKVRRAAAF